MTRLPALADLLDPNVFIVSSDMTFADVLTSLSCAVERQGEQGSKPHCQTPPLAAIVVERESCVGTITEADLARTIARGEIEDDDAIATVMKPPQICFKPGDRGLLSEREIWQYRALALELSQIAAREAVTATLVTISASASLAEAFQQMQSQNVERLGVIDEQAQLCGTIAQSDILQALNPDHLYSTIQRLEAKIAILEDRYQTLLEQHRQDLEQRITERTEAAQQQAERSRLLAQIATQILSSLNLEQILNTTATQVRNLLECDRVTIYQFAADGGTTIVAEAIPDGFPSFQGQTLKDPCLTQQWLDAYRHGRIHTVADIYTAGMSDCHAQFLAQHDIRAKILVPIILEQDNLWGLISASQSDRPRQWQTSEVELIKQIATQVALAIQQAKLYRTVQAELQERVAVEEQLRTQARQQAAIAQISQLALATDDLNSLLNAAADAIATTLTVDYCGILELLPNQSVLLLRAGVGWPRAWLGQAQISANHQTQEGHSLRWFCPVVTADLRLETRFSGTAFLHNRNIVSGVSIPIPGKDKPWGVLSVYSTEKRSFSTDDVYFLIAIANTLAVVAERLQAETELDRFFNLSLDLFGIASKEGYFKRVNPQFEKVLGYSPLELKQTAILDLVHPDDRDRSLAAVEQLSQSFPLVNFENRYRCKDGQYRWLAWTAVPYESELFYCVARDVSDRRQIEAQLHQLNTELESRVRDRTAQLQHANQQLQQALLEHQRAEVALHESIMTNRALLDAIPDSMFRFSRNGRFINVKAPRDTAFCLPPEQFLGKFVTEILPPDIAQKMQQCIAQALTTGKLQVIEYELRHNHSTHWEARFVPNGHSEAIAIIRDISDRVAAQEALRYSEERFRIALKNSPIVVFNQDTDLRYTWIYNPALGYEAENVIGGFDTDIFASGDAQQLIALKQQVLDAGTGLRQEVILGQEDALLCYDLTIDPLYSRSGAIIGVTCAALDISDRKRAELALQESQRFIQRIAEASPDILYIFDLEQQCNLYSNRQLAEILGYTPAEIQAMGSNFIPSLIHPQDLPKIIEYHQKVAITSDGDTLELEYRLQDKQGNWHWLASRETVFSRNSAGVPKQMVGTAADITQRKQTEERLRLSERAIASSTNSIVITDARLADRPIVSVNPAFERITGYTAAEVIGKNCRFLQQGDRDQPELTVLRQAIAAETSCTVILRNYRKDGTLFWNELSVSPIYDEQGQLTHFLGIQNDITEARQAELARRIAQERLQYLLSSSPGILYSYQMFGDFRATFISDNTEKLLGYTQAEMQQPGFWASHIHPDDAPAISTQSNQKLLANNQNAHEYRFQHKDGHYLWIYDQLSLVRDENNNPLEAIGYWIDISDRKRVEQQLVTSLQEKELLLKEIHHRVKNNLLVVSNILEFQADYTSEPEIIKILEDSQHRIYSMALIHEKLYRSTDLARINFDEYLESLVDNLAQSYTSDNQNIKILLNIEPLSLNVETAQPCGLIVNELISNAFKHAFPNQRVGVIALNLSRQETGEIKLEIADDGIGLPANLDLHNVESLGLELIVTLAQQLESTLELNRDRGTCFKLTFSELNYRQRF
jgi:PAS domain S-box-containing protein